MILRRLTRHVKDQNWFAVGLDFLIVVIGVFIGIQVSNWNDARSFKQREQLLLRELRTEVSQNMADSKIKGEAFLVGAAAARRILSRIDNEEGCAEDCWQVVVDLMHASQWQQIFDSWTTYEELRQDGLPTDRRVIELVQVYKALSHQVFQSMSERPQYRTLVRGLIPIELQDIYWQRCYTIENAVEIYFYPCVGPDNMDIDAGVIDDILKNEELVSSLREWTSIARVVGDSMVNQQQEVGAEILKAIDGEEGRLP